MCTNNVIKQVQDPLTIAGRSFTSRLMIGTGKFSSPEIMKHSIDAAESEIVTVAVRRTNLTDATDSFTTIINPKEYLFFTKYIRC